MKKATPRPKVSPAVLAAGRKLSKMQRTFAEALVRDPERNMTKAARAAGSKGPRFRGSKWAKDPRVVAYMDALVAEAERFSTLPDEALAMGTPAIIAHAVIMETQEVLERITEAARVDMADFISVGEPPAPVGGDTLRPSPATLHSQVYFDWAKAVARGKTHLIKEITWNRDGHPCIKLVDSQSALMGLARIKGLLQENDRDDEQAVAKVEAALRKVGRAALREVHLALLGQGATVETTARVIPEATRVR